jgi:septum formation protein
LAASQTPLSTLTHSPVEMRRAAKTLSGICVHLKIWQKRNMLLILASKSPFRALILKNAGIAFRAEPANIDERTVEAPLFNSGATPEDVAQILAKAVDVSERFPGDLVLGSDQTLSLDDEVFHKPRDMEEARRHLLRLSGRTHQLNSAMALAKNGETLWRHVSVARLTVRALSPEYIGRHLAAVGEAALQSVGAYQYEGFGIQLFDSIEGDYFTIVGLPILPLLHELRRMSEING